MQSVFSAGRIMGDTERDYKKSLSVMHEEEWEKEQKLEEGVFKLLYTAKIVRSIACSHLKGGNVCTLFEHLFTYSLVAIGYLCLLRTPMIYDVGKKALSNQTSQQDGLLRTPNINDAGKKSTFKPNISAGMHVPGSWHRSFFNHLGQNM
jgi:hypothetical protein